MNDRNVCPLIVSLALICAIWLTNLTMRLKHTEGDVGEHKTELKTLREQMDWVKSWMKARSKG